MPDKSCEPEIRNALCFEQKNDSTNRASFFDGTANLRRGKREVQIWKKALKTQNVKKSTLKLIINLQRLSGLNVRVDVKLDRYGKSLVALTREVFMKIIKVLCLQEGAFSEKVAY